MESETQLPPSLGDLTFDAEPRREWTPPHPHSPMAKLWDDVPRRTVASTSSAISPRSLTTSKPASRPATDTRVYDIRRSQTPAMFLPPQQPPSLLTEPRIPSSLSAAAPPAAHQPGAPAAAPSPGSPQASSSRPDPPPRGNPLAHQDPRRCHLRPVRIVSEPSFTQLPVSELPSVRGQQVAPLSPTGRGNAVANGGASGGGIGAGSCGRQPLADVTAAVTAAGGASGGGGDGARSCSPGGPSPGAHHPPHHLPDHLSVISSHLTFSTQQSTQDRVDTYLDRYQMHQRILDHFRVRRDEHLRTVQELGERIQAMTRVAPAGAAVRPGGGCPGGSEVAAEAGRGRAVEGNKAQLNPGGPLSPQGGPPVSAAGSQQHHPQQHQSLPEHPLQPRNRFMPQITTPTTSTTNNATTAAPATSGRTTSPVPAAAAATPNPTATTTATTTASASASSSPGAAGRPRPSSAASTSSSVSWRSPTTTTTTAAGRCNSASPTTQLLRSGLTGDGTELSFGPGRSASGGGSGGGDGATAAVTASAAGVTHGSAGDPGGPRVPSPHPQQGAYLALPDSSFAGSPPLRGVPITEGLLFERYSRKSQAVDLPELQLRYIRPGIIAPREPRQARRVARQPAPPARALPNGIPASRLERLSARRRDRSPPRLYQQHLLLQQQMNSSGELLKFTGAPLIATVTSSLGSPMGFGSPTGTLSGGGAGPSGSGAATATGMAAVGDGLLRSASLASPSAVPLGRSCHPGGVGGRAASAPSISEGGGGPLAQYLAVPTSSASGEPLLDENFYQVLQTHFRSTIHAQTQQLRAQLNVNLPLVLGALNCVNVAEPPPSGISGGGDDGSGGGAGGVSGSRATNTAGEVKSRV